MISLLPNAVAVKDELGDVLCGKNFIHGWLTDEQLQGKRLYLLSFCDWDHWRALGIVTENQDLTNRILEAVQYECPWTSNKFCWFYPVAILSENNDHSICSTRGFQNVDVMMTVNEDDPGLEFVRVKDMTGNRVIAMMGHGYTCGTLPSDGHGCRKWAYINLDNHDQILVSCWVWYNK